MFRWVRRIVVWALLLVVAAGGALAAAYYSGVTIPLFHDLTPVTFSNWNKTARIQADVDHDSSLVRRGARAHFLVDLQMPQAPGRLQAFLDGGRTELVACGPQKLFMHSLTNSTIGIDGDRVSIRGAVNMELAGPIKLRDDWPMASVLKVGHDRTTVWADVVSLQIANVPDPMIEALLKGHKRFAYTREQVLDALAKSMKPGDAAILAEHREALDLAFETVRPTLRGDALVLDAVVSVDEGTALEVISARLFAAAGARLGDVADLLGPSQANAQLKLDDLRKDLEGAGKKILKDVGEGRDPTGILDRPSKTLETIWSALPPCKVSF